MSKSKSLKTMIEELDEATNKTDAKFSDWEYNFIESIVGQLEKHEGNTTFLSLKQAETIDRIYNKYL